MHGDGVMDCFGHAPATFVANADSTFLIAQLPISSVICEIIRRGRLNGGRGAGEPERLLNMSKLKCVHLERQKKTSCGHESAEKCKRSANLWFSFSHIPSRIDR